MKWLKKLLWRGLSFFLRLFGFRYAAGTMTLVVSGQKSIRIETGFMPNEVWITLKEPKGAACCGADMDCFDWRTMPDGFVLLVKLASNSREIEWVATN